MSGTQPEMSPRERIKTQTEKITRRVGYVVFMGGALAIFIPMLIGVGRGINSGEVRDPYSGDLVGEASWGASCDEEARTLLMDAGSNQVAAREWERRYQVWLSRCRHEEADLYRLLQRTQGELGEASAKSTP